MIGLVAWCRVWLGVHWTSDVVGALAIAFVALSAAHAVIDRSHHATPDVPDDSDVCSEPCRAPIPNSGTEPPSPSTDSQALFRRRGA